MNINVFDVVEMKNGNRATILDIRNNRYWVEIVNAYGVIIKNTFITNNEISKIVYSNTKER